MAAHGIGYDIESQSFAVVSTHQNFDKNIETVSIEELFFVGISIPSFVAVLKIETIQVSI